MYYSKGSLPISSQKIYSFDKAALDHAQGFPLGMWRNLEASFLQSQIIELLIKNPGMKLHDE